MEKPIKLWKEKEQILSEFKCLNTGNCCKEDGTVYVTDENIKKMAQVLHLSEFEFREKYVRKKNGWSVVADHSFRPNCFLNSCKQCSVYEGRPEHCKTYPNWPEIWESKQAFESERKICKGLREAADRVYKKLSNSRH